MAPTSANPSPQDPDGEQVDRPAKETQYATQDMLRAMSHPLRLDLMERIGRRGTARAADLAADIGVPANSVSYHLRILARGGVIEEAPEYARDKRDRVWRLTRSTFQAQNAGHTNDPVNDGEEYVDATNAVSLAAFEWVRGAWIREAAHQREHGMNDPGYGQLFVNTVHVSAEQSRELSSMINEKVEEYAELNRDANGVDLPDAPDSDGDAQDFRVLFAIVGDRPDQEGNPEPLGTASTMA